MSTTTYTLFLPTRRYVSALYVVVVCPSVCPSVCLSVTSQYCIKTDKHRMLKTIPHDTLVLCCERFLQNSDGITPNGSAKCSWGSKSCVFRLVEAFLAQTLTAKYLCTSATVFLVHDVVMAPGGGIRDVINNFGGGRRLLVIVTV